MDSYLRTIPADYEVVCVANACRDETVAAIVVCADELRCDVHLLDLREPGKMNAVMQGVLWARRKGFTHFVLVDDDVR